MNTIKIGTVLLLTGTFAFPVMADETYYDTARVISVAPQVERVNVPHQECRTEYIRDSSYSSGSRDIGGSILGGIAGGLIGSQIGKGNGRVAGAAIGAAAGAIVGDRIDNSDRRDSGYNSRPIERCSSVDNWQNVTRNYFVTYRYNGHDYTTTLGYDPGDNMRVRVAVMPEAGSRDNMSYFSGYPADNGWHRGWDKRRDHDERWRN